MLFIEKLSMTIDRWIGTLVQVHDDSIEIELSDMIMSIKNAHGLCMSKQDAKSLLFESIVKNQQFFRYHFIRKSIKALLKATQKPSNIWFVIALKKTNIFDMFYGIRKELVQRRALRNHERMHALTMHYDEAWHTIAQNTLQDVWKVHWTKTTNEIRTIPVYQKLIQIRGGEKNNDSYVVVSEMIARLAAVAHAPDDLRLFVAKNELPQTYKSLLWLCRDVISRWGGVEQLIGWLHSQRWCD